MRGLLYLLIQYLNEQKRYPIVLAVISEKIFIVFAFCASRLGQRGSPSKTVLNAVILDPATHPPE